MSAISRSHLGTRTPERPSSLLTRLWHALLWGSVLFVGVHAMGVGLWGNVAMREQLTTEYRHGLREVDTHGAVPHALWLGWRLLKKGVSPVLIPVTRLVNSTTQWACTLWDTTVPPHLFDPAFKQMTKKSQGLFHVLWWAFLVMGLKWLGLLQGVGLLVFMSLLGAMEGLSRRHIRTAEGGRESTFLYHRVGRCLSWLPVGLLVVYISLPLWLSPAPLSLVMSGCLFFFLSVRMACLKKYV